MPELPEVEAVVRTLGPLVQNRRIRCVHVLHPIATKPQAASHLARFVQGRRIRTVGCRRNYFLFLPDGGCLTGLFRSNAPLLWFSIARDFLEPATGGETAFRVDLALYLGNGPRGFAPRPLFGRA